MLVLFCLVACDANSSSSFQCDLHTVKDEMPGLAAFQGGARSGGIDATLSLYRDAMAAQRLAAAEAYFCMGEILVSFGRAQEALDMYEQSIAENDSLYEHFLARAQLRTSLGDCSGALADFESVIINGGAGFIVDLTRAQALVDCGYAAEALSALDSAGSKISGRVMPVDWVFTRARVLAVQEEYEEALLQAEDAVRRITELGNCLPVMSRCINPRLIEVVDLKTDILCRMGRVEDAAQIYDLHGKYQQPRATPPACLE